MDELAERLRHRPDRAARCATSPTSTPRPASRSATAGCVECLRARAPSGSAGPTGRRSPAPPLDGDWWVGTGVASATYPAYTMPGNSRPDRHAATTAATPSRSAPSTSAPVRGPCSRRSRPTRSSVDARRDRPRDRRHAAAAGLGRRRLVRAPARGVGAIVAAAQRFRADHGDHPDPGVATTASAADDPATSRATPLHSFGAVLRRGRGCNRCTGEIRVPRLLGVYSVGRVINPVDRPLASSSAAWSWDCRRRCSRSRSATRASATS